MLVGAALLLLTLPGWVMNLGHRLEVVRRVYHDEPPYFRGFAPWRTTFVRGLSAFCAIALSKPVETSYVEAVQRRMQALCDCRKQTEVRQGGDPELYKAVAGAKARWISKECLGRSIIPCSCRTKMVLCVPFGIFPCGVTRSLN